MSRRLRAGSHRGSTSVHEPGAVRKRATVRAGTGYVTLDFDAALTGAFVVLRFVGGYGEPRSWADA